MNMIDVQDNGQITRPGSRSRPPHVALLVGLSLALGLMGGYLAGGRTQHSVTVLRGSAYTNIDRTAIGFTGHRVAGPRSGVSNGFVVAGAQWFDGQSWHDSSPPGCLKPIATTKVELGVISSDPYKDAPGTATVVWLKCL